MRRTDNDDVLGCLILAILAFVAFVSGCLVGATLF